MMQKIKTAGLYQVGLGEVVSLTEGQFASRAHNLEVVQREGEGDTARVTARAKSLLSFKAGEQIMVESVPKGMMHLIEQPPAPPVQVVVAGVPAIAGSESAFEHPASKGPGPLRGRR